MSWRYESTSGSFRSGFADDFDYHYPRGRSPSPVRFSSRSRRRHVSPLVYRVRYGYAPEEGRRRSPSPSFYEFRRRSPSPERRGRSPSPVRRRSPSPSFYGSTYRAASPGRQGRPPSPPPEYRPYSPNPFRPRRSPSPDSRGYQATSPPRSSRGSGFYGPETSGPSGPGFFQQHRPRPSGTHHPNAGTRERYVVSEYNMRVYEETYRQLLGTGMSQQDAARYMDEEIYRDIQRSGQAPPPRS